MPVCGSVGALGGTSSGMGYHKSTFLKTNAGQGKWEERATDKMPNFVGCLDFAWRWKMIAWWLRSPIPTAEVLVRIPGEIKFILSNRNEIGEQKRWGVGSGGYVMVTSAGSCAERGRLRVWEERNWSVLLDC